MKVVKGTDAAYDTAQHMLGSRLVTVQTGPEGKVVQRLLIEQGVEIERELYLGITLDRATSRVTIMASTEGGTEIEEVAEHSPEKILREGVDPATGLGAFQSRKLAFGLGLDKKPAASFSRFVSKLVAAYDRLDCSLLEINPLVITKQGDVLALDAKANFDDNALFRHAALEDHARPGRGRSGRARGQKVDLSFVNLDGNIGCMVNGAGLAMATMDIIKFFGAEPANFLDVGGGATVERVTSRVQNHHARPQPARDLGQHFRRHHEVRHHRPGGSRCGSGGWTEGAARRAPRGHQRRARPQNPSKRAG